MCNDMKYTKTGVVVSLSSSITLSECQIRALDALVGYGFEPFLKHFKEKLGTAYIRDHEDGLKDFFETVEKEVRPQLRKCDELREQLGGPKVFCYMIENSLQNARIEIDEHRSHMEVMRNQVFLQYKQAIAEYVNFFGGPYAGFYNHMVYDILSSSIVVKYMVSRRDPLFDDYEARLTIPDDYLTAPDRSLWLKSREQELELEREKEKIEEKQKKLKEALLKQAATNREVEELLG